MPFKLQDPGCPCCGGICDGVDPAPLQDFADDFSTDLSQWTVTSGSAAISGGKVVITRSGPNAFIFSPILGCNRSGFTAEVSAEFHGVTDSMTEGPAGNFFFGFVGGSGFVASHLWKPPGGLFPNEGRYIFQNPNGLTHPPETDIPVVGDTIAFALANSGTAWDWSISLNGTVKRSGILNTPPTQGETCNMVIRLGSVLNGAFPSGPTYQFDNVIATLTCSG